MKQTLADHFLRAFHTADIAFCRIQRAGQRHRCMTGAVIFAVSLGMFFCHYLLEDTLSRDSITYLEAIRRTSEAGWLSYLPDQNFPPLLIVLVADFVKLGLSPITAGLILNFTSAALLPLLAYAIAGRIFHRYGIAVLCAALMLLHPGMTKIAVAIQRDAPGLALQFLAVYLFLCAVENHWNAAMFCSGMVLAASMNFRYENMEFALLLPVFWIAYFFSSSEGVSTGLFSRGFRRNLLLPICTFYAGILVGVLGCAWYCRQSDFFQIDQLESHLGKYCYFLKF